MRRYCIVANKDKANADSLANEICGYLKEKDCECIILKNKIMENNGKSYYTDASLVPDDTDCIIVLGGDGTMIQAANDLAEKNIPLYGINLGGVGFLTESDTDCMWRDIDNLIDGNYRAEKRMMLKGNVTCHGEQYEVRALNDLVLSKREYGKLICFEVCINGSLLDNFIADGLIISTPTGSTGYNLSAGGPVISPEMEAVAVTAVCPHSLNDRSFIIGGDDTISIKLLNGKNSEEDTALIISDGRVITDIKSGETLHIEKDSLVTRIVMMKKTNFYHRMRTKHN